MSRTTERKFSLFSVLMDAFQGGRQIRAQSEKRSKKRKDLKTTWDEKCKKVFAEGKPRAEDGGGVRFHGIWCGQSQG